MKRSNRVILIFLFIIFFAVFFLLPIVKRHGLIKKELEKTKTLEKEIEEQKKKKEALEKDIKENSKTENIEKVARNQLNMSSKDERIYKFVDDTKGEKKDGASK